MSLFQFYHCWVSMLTCLILQFGFECNQIFHLNKIYSNSMLKRFNLLYLLFFFSLFYLKYVLGSFSYSVKNILFTFKALHCCCHMVLLWLYNGIENGSNNWYIHSAFRWSTTNYRRSKILFFISFKIFFFLFFIKDVFTTKI
jgi:hypothetical protein